MKKLLSTLALATTLTVTATAALADSGRIADRRTQPAPRPDLRPVPPPPVVAPRPGPIVAPKPVPALRPVLLASKQATARRGQVTMTVRPGGAYAGQRDLYLATSDQRLDIRMVRITYASGRTAIVRGSQASTLDLPDHGRIARLDITYVNRGARAAEVMLLAKAGGRPGRPGWIG